MSPTSSPPLNPNARSRARGPQSDARSKAKRSAAKDAGQPSSKKRAKARSEGDSKEIGGSRADDSSAGGRASSDSSVQDHAEPPADIDEASHCRSRKKTVDARAHETPSTGDGDLGQDASADKGGPATAGVTSTDSTDRAGMQAEKAARGRGNSRSGGRARPSGKNPAAANSIGSSGNGAGATKSKCRKSKKPAEPHSLAVAHEDGGEGPVVVEGASSGRPASKNESASAGRDATNDTTAEGPEDAAVASERDGDATSPTSITSIMATLSNQGYSTVAGILSDDEVDIVLRAINASHPRQWFRHLGDQNRRQMDVDMRTDADSAHPAFQLVLERFIAFASQLHPSWGVCERLSVLESQPGAEAERLHRDFSASETTEAINAREWV
ncbi:hypothetical protein PR001_g19769 [Phytophthora rubi]|uniref:Uncharacterized protein n=1 Tax=Phytophthora rubi TaxID=129364 RepID=A0A6A3JE67_9STRA|nr:hypothetical protein PR002_g20199 [Phytophthora rubi]KAE8996748.1 hypothetical protein PR001_g19769 [Phytophthora rubi]